MAKCYPKPKPNADALLDPASLHGLTGAFLAWMTAMHYSPHTLRTRAHALNFFLRWCDERGLTRPAEINRPILERYRRHTYAYRQANGKPLSLKTQMHRLIAVRTFFKWMTRHHHLLYNPAGELELPRSQKCLPSQILSIIEVETIIALTNIHEPLGLRDRAILETLWTAVGKLDGVSRSQLQLEPAG